MTRMKIIIGKKIAMTQVFSATGEVVPVTRISAGPCPVVQVKTKGTDNTDAIQLGFGEKKEYLIKKPQLGHLKDLSNLRDLHDFSVDKVGEVKRGDLVTVDTFVEGERVAVVGQSKGKGFQGVVRRHHFRGGPATHGHKDNLRAPGSIGAGGVQRVFKGMRMAGHMGADRVTVKNLEVVKIDSVNNELYLKGAVPGGRGGLLFISAPGELKVAVTKVAEVPVVAEQPAVEMVAEAQS
ncbi:MAG: 50S ribosomal protein L3 [Candidatus Magasanikbacteria bacterium RIFOXYC2_FULL_42_28]|uniref:Large ribosomal subunit protein uL3 n=1 Tax=Candidatus Magasanikbacteria bacterium RIFOXYC2_FULL_42_28 TaxID=1798704 RepID=A0A1F6NU68_9BACT|nr:MAG: 50S ribosomal protein L3 [Candidatus Magasanikbacteria bacterium RIFOXYC2_FULL_42_28]